MHPSKFGFGQPVRRKEDEALLRGCGRYVCDYAPEGVLAAVVLRSPHAHARFHISDLEAVRRMPGVRLLLTAEDLDDLGPLPCQGLPPGVRITVPPYRVLAKEEVRHVGDAIALIVADHLDQARDAAEAVKVSFTALPHVVDAIAALAEDAPLVWPKAPGNVAFDIALGDAPATRAAFGAAAHCVSLNIINQRLVTNYLDTRAAVGEYDGGRDAITLTLGSQGGHAIREVLCESVLKIPPEKLRVITPDVGGGFGTKLFPYREYALVAVAAKRLQQPVKWVADRTEHFLADTQGRDNITRARLALDADKRFLAFEVDTVANMGAYLSCYAPFIPYIGAAMLPGVYDIAACHVRIRGVHTHTLPVDAYRGAGRPEAAYVIERLVDTAAHELGIAPDDLRRRNFIAASAMPYTTATGKIYDSGEFAGHLWRAQELGHWDDFASRALQSKQAGKLRGRGFATYIEACGNNGPETAMVRLEADGTATVLIGSQSTGQGHHTAYAQLIAEHLTLPPERVRIIQGDTALIKTGMGTGGSSSIPCGGAAVAKAANELADNLKTLAAEELETSPADLEIVNASVRVAGTDRAIDFTDLARSHGHSKQLCCEQAFQPSEATYPNGTHLAEVEIDCDTGAVELVSYIVVDDFGATLNPLMLAGQVHGGSVQGIGQALMERTVYDADSGQLITASLMDYPLPRAADLPPFIFETRNVKCRTNPLGVKGAGEAGAIGSCPAVVNAVVDALWRAYRIRHVDMPVTAERVWAAINEARRLHTL